MSEFEKELLDAIIESIKPAMIRREWIQKYVSPVIQKYGIDEPCPTNGLHEPIEKICRKCGLRY